MRTALNKIRLLYKNAFGTGNPVTKLFDLLLLLPLLLWGNSAIAQGDGGVEDKPHFATPFKGQVSVAIPASYRLFDDETSYLDYFSFPGIETTQVGKKIKNIITFKINEEAQSYISADFTASVTVKIEYGHSATAFEEITKILTVTYDKDAGSKYNAQQYFHFEGAEYVKVTIMAVSAPIVGNLNTKDILVLDNEMRVTRYFELPTIVPNPTLFTHTTPATGTIPDHLEVKWAWPLHTGNNATQLEWVWLEDEVAGNYIVNGNLDYNLLFKNNSTRIDLPLDKHCYDIPLLYDGVGKLYYRIRAVNIKGSGSRSDGPWYRNTSNEYFFVGHNNSLNWQSSTTFAEEGKRKTVVQYYDGSLRSRQTVTKDNTTNTTVVAETFYDGQGRPAIQILPSPGISNIIQYQASLNKFNGTNPDPDEDPVYLFDFQPLATPNSLTPELLTTSGTSKYYSPSNVNASTGINKNIPDAEGYPYATTRYTPDGTGRILMQSGVGIAHTMGSGHETKYYYGTPAQEELDGLFGTEVGFFPHYSKNMVKDANGQMSISYVDMHGRTIATALAGNSPGNLDALDKNNSSHYPGQAGTPITRNFLDNGTNNLKGNTIESINSILVPVATTYNFSYTLSPEILQMPACEGATPASLCYDCLYDLEIAIVDESGEQTEPVTFRKYTNVSLTTPDDNCSTSQSPVRIVAGNDAVSQDIAGNVISFSKSLPEGSYSVRKTLSISESSFQHYKELYMSKALCKSEQEIIDSIYNVLSAASDCNNPVVVTCQSCIESLGSYANYLDNYLSSIAITPDSASPELLNEIHAAYASDSANCAMICGGSGTVSQSLPSIREMMLADMMPYGGQYATENATGHTAGTVQAMYDKYNIFSIATPSVAYQPYYKNPAKNNVKDFYYDDLDGRDQSIHPDLTTTHEYDFLNITTKETFTQLFKNSWAKSLLPYHPEYGRLVFAETHLATSYNWINSFYQTESWSAAQSNGYQDPTTIDPFFSEAPNDYKVAVTTDIGNYQGMGVGMWQLAYGDLRCKSISNETERNDCYVNNNPGNLPPPYTGFTTAENDQAWQVFRGLYLEARNRQVNKYIAEQNPLPSNDENDLVAQNYRLWFPRSYNQAAAQHHWDWWPATSPDTTHPGIPPGGNTSPTQVYESRCSSYIAQWKSRLLQCSKLDSSNRDTILNQITSRMLAVCVNGSNQANPYGSSTINPSLNPVPADISFEQIIKDVYSAYGIVTNDIYNDNYCNPFVIDWPKPYGKNPVIVAGEMTGQIDSCNCKQYGIIKRDATLHEVDITNLSLLNNYLRTNYGDTLTSVMFDGLKHCDLPPGCECKDLEHTVDLYYQQYPNGGMDTCFGIPSYLELNTRSGNTPLQYKATDSIAFVAGFESGINDEFEAFIDSTGACDTTANCQQLFTNFFNDHYNYHPPYTWGQIDTLFNTICGRSPNVCGTKNYGCPELIKVECLFKVTDTFTVGPCSNAFVNFFNSYYHNDSRLDSVAISNLYIECDPALWINVCKNLSPCVYDSVSCVNQIPYTLPQPQPFPEFLKCGYEKNSHCLNCADLSSLTAEFKIKFTSPIDSAPLFTGTDLTPVQIEYNKNYARFINYRTGFQFGWLDYSQAAANATPQCNLDVNNSNATQNVICEDTRPLTDGSWVHTDTLCHKVRIMAIALGQQVYQARRLFLLQRFQEAYKTKCLQSATLESFSASYITSEYHYTLYYYDMAGNLVKTVPPKGVRPNFEESYTAEVKTKRLAGISYPRPHEFITQYRYNSLNQAIAQKTPDAGISNFWYDRLGRLAVSQNAQQAIDNKYSYTLYDPLGRIYEVGQKPQTTAMNQALSQNLTSLNAWINIDGGTKEQITRTTYDIIATNLTGLSIPAPIIQQNLRNRVSYVQTFATDPGTASFDHKNATYYTYDIHGNVDNLLQDFKAISADISDESNRFKRIAYGYDLISGKVNNVSYQPNQWDAFYHKYEYDAENRITIVNTSRDKIVWERDAAYNYYKHGPLARTELGQLRVQGLDYAYTLQGWLKGLNNTGLIQANDIYQDGSIPVPKDVLSFALHYYDQMGTGSDFIDYKAIGGTSPFARPGSGIGFETRSLYNGNIAAMSVNNAGLLKLDAGTNNTIPLFYKYSYDQLNRIVSMQAYKGLTASTNVWTPVAIDDYKEQVSYDPNGNIETYNRKGAPTAGKPTTMDDLGYNYYTGTNRLQQVTDNVTASNYTEDIDNQSNTSNYTYDAIGNMTGDAAEGITSIDWNVYGKISNIVKGSNTISYTYDASGNRVSKTVGSVTTIYVRDASGNVMSLYEKGTSFVLKENHLYGSSRLGMSTQLSVEPVSSALDGDFDNATLSTFTRGEKIFELNNHLGNVLATVSDKKLGHDDGNGTIDYYDADIVTANDYYPFGMQMPGRKYSANSSYRYGFNGKENDNEVKGVGNQQDYGERIYDPRIGKFLSVDPLAGEYPMLTPYQFASNRPIDGVDQDGLEWKPVTGADGNVTDYTWSGFNADGSAPAGTVSGGSIVRDGATYTLSSTSFGDYRTGGLSIDNGSNVRMNATIWSGGSSSYSFDELNEDGGNNIVFASGPLGTATGASGTQIGSALNQKFKDYEFATTPRPPSGAIESVGTGVEYIGLGELKLLSSALGAVVIKVGADVVAKKVVAKVEGAMLKKASVKQEYKTLSEAA
ncbi:MAG TPA: RHS repeat-associated core domain-containing protein, partial [Ferruginibacter sp.]|nr:RHS repeat-associated core domain-containing protein [Ferruginibacter sp.]